MQTLDSSNRITISATHLFEDCCSLYTLIICFEIPSAGVVVNWQLNTACAHFSDYAIEIIHEIYCMFTFVSKHH